MVETKLDPNIPYSQMVGERNSWVDQGMPALFKRFVKLVAKSGLEGYHLDVGTFDGIKAVCMAKTRVLSPLVGVDIDVEDKSLPRARKLAVWTGLSQENITFIKADARVELPIPDNSVASVTNICVAGTHFNDIERAEHAKELCRVLQEGGYMLSVDFSALDVEFYGEVIANEGIPVFKEYTYIPNPSHPYAKIKYLGMFNQHQDSDRIPQLYGPNFELMGVIHRVHPNAKKDPAHVNRFLWETIYRKVSGV